jgi:hypothetical protein
MDADQATGEMIALVDRQVAQLRRWEQWRRWLTVAALWIFVGGWSCWQLRDSIALLGEYFSWTGLRYVVMFNFWGGGVGLIICFATTVSTMFWQLLQWWWPPSDRERHRLEQQAAKVFAPGSRHPLRRWLRP